MSEVSNPSAFNVSTRSFGSPLCVNRNTNKKDFTNTSITKFPSINENICRKRKSTSKMNDENANPGNNNSMKQPTLLKVNTLPEESQTITEHVRQSKPRRQKVKHVFKILVVGNSKCGKTSLIHRYTEDAFDTNYNITIGADYSKKIVKVNDTDSARLQLWDIAGQDRFANLTRPFYQNAKAAVIVCDVSRLASLEAVKSWKADLDDKLLREDGKHSDFPCIIIANKCDLLTGIPQAMELGARIENLCGEMNIKKWFIASAKDGENVNQAMEYLVDTLIEQDMATKSEIQTDDNNIIRLGSTTEMTPMDEMGCC